jgi:glutaredoxin 3
MTNVVIYSTKVCPYCEQAKQLLRQKNVAYTEFLVDTSPEKRDEMIAKSGRRSVPQIFINDQHIGGCDDLYAANKSGKLDKLLATPTI